MDFVKKLFNRTDFWRDILKYGVCLLVFDRHLDCSVVNVFDDMLLLLSLPRRGVRGALTSRAGAPGAVEILVAPGEGGG